MMRRLILTLTIALGFAFGNPAGPAQAQNLAEVSKVLNQGLGRVLVYSGGRLHSTGIGFVIAKINNDEYYFATNAHVAGSTSYRYRIGFVPDHSSGQIIEFDGRIVEVSGPQDLAILKITRDNGSPDTPLRPVPIFKDPPDQGATVASFGFPGVADIATERRLNKEFYLSSMTTGVVGRVTVSSTFAYPKPIPGHTVQVIQHDASIAGGNSGGPLVNACAGVVGVNTQSLGLSSESRRVYQASTSNELLDLIERTNLKIQPITTACNGTIATVSGINAISGSGQLSTAVLIMIVLGTLTVVSGGLFAYGRSRSSGSSSRSSSGRSSRGSGRSWGKSSKPVVNVMLRGPNGTGKAVGVTRKQLESGAIIGRSSKADIIIEDPRVSGQHATLSLRDRKLRIKDLNSSNGTKVDGQKVPGGGSVTLSSRSTVQIGDSSFTVKKI